MLGCTSQSEHTVPAKQPATAHLSYLGLMSRQIPRSLDMKGSKDPGWVLKGPLVFPK